MDDSKDDDDCNKLGMLYNKISERIRVLSKRYSYIKDNAQSYSSVDTDDLTLVLCNDKLEETTDFLGLVRINKKHLADLLEACEMLKQELQEYDYPHLLRRLSAKEKVLQRRLSASCRGSVPKVLQRCWEAQCHLQRCWEAQAKVLQRCWEAGKVLQRCWEAECQEERSECSLQRCWEAQSCSKEKSCSDVGRLSAKRSLAAMLGGSVPRRSLAAFGRLLQRCWEAQCQGEVLQRCWEAQCQGEVLQRCWEAQCQGEVLQRCWEAQWEACSAQYQGEVLQRCWEAQCQGEVLQRCWEAAKEKSCEALLGG
ncbi:hypothetical protein CEXT_446591 [Caerostris extrusa]|uniref:Uncharacterized protein n=1 Tax=Caerostris extrusa TaxID=172846 RepID=A0AAV4SWJ7_CAEEX|nr:hypothetical protein CEXT_446591 [Caerostris extrusa]